MAALEKPKDLEQILNPFFARAAEAEERLSKLEAVLAAKKGDCNVEDEKVHIDTTKAEQACDGEAPEDFQVHTAENVKQASGTPNIMEENSELVAENTKLKLEITKLNYRVTHLLRALKEADDKLESK